MSSADMGKQREAFAALQLTIQGFPRLDFYVQPCTVFFDIHFRFLFILLDFDLANTFLKNLSEEP